MSKKDNAVGYLAFLTEYRKNRIDDRDSCIQMYPVSRTKKSNGESPVPFGGVCRSKKWIHLDTTDVITVDSILDLYPDVSSF